MPPYEFMCEGCKKGFEVTLTFGERTTAHVKCPKCESRKVTPQMTDPRIDYGTAAAQDRGNLKLAFCSRGLEVTS